MNHVVFDVALGCAVQTRSCDHCFSRKIKCNRRKPCSSCLENDAPCRYERPRKKRRFLRSELTTSSGAGNNFIRGASSPLDWSCIGVGNALADSDPEAAETPHLTTTDDLVDRPATDASPMYLGPGDLAIDTGEGFYHTSILGFADFPTYAPQSPVHIPDSPALHLTPPMPILSSQNAKLDYLLNDSSIPQLVNVFLERLQQSMPFFTHSFLRQNLAGLRHLHDRSFGSLIQAICSLVLLQPVQSQDKRPWPNREARADAHLALAVHLHSQSDLGQAPTLETILTSVFLFACHFCKGNFDAARFRLREAAALAEVMNLDKPDSYGYISDTEKQRRMRTLIGLTILERIYSVQRDYVPSTNTLNRQKLQELQDAIASSPDRGESENIIAIEGFSRMLEQVDFIDTDMIKCWKGNCWNESPPTHVTQSTILGLLRRYRVPPQLSWLSDVDTHAQHADIMVTRHWIRIKLWTLAHTHDYIGPLSSHAEFRHEYALAIAKEALDTASQFEMTSLEVHGVGLVEKLSDIATCAALQVDAIYLASTTAEDHSLGSSSSTAPPDALDSPSDSGCSAVQALGDAENTLNGYLALFASFRRGKHPFLKPYMRLLGDIKWLS